MSKVVAVPMVLLLLLLSLVNAQSVKTVVSTSCGTIPSPTLETTPITTQTRTVTSNGQTFIGVTEVYQSITYVEDCTTLEDEEHTSTLLIWWCCIWSHLPNQTFSSPSNKNCPDWIQLDASFPGTSTLHVCPMTVLFYIISIKYWRCLYFPTQTV